MGGGLFSQQGRNTSWKGSFTAGDTLLLTNREIDHARVNAFCHEKERTPCHRFRHKGVLEKVPRPDTTHNPRDGGEEAGPDGSKTALQWNALPKGISRVLGGG